MKHIKNLIINIILVFIALILFYPLTIINLFTVKNWNRYFYETALSVDIFAQYEFRSLWNKILIKKDSKFLFGKDRRVSISYLLGKNKYDNTLTRFGIIVSIILNFFDTCHVEKAVILTEEKYPDLIF